MESLIKSDVFFFITSAAVIIVSIVVVVALYYVIKILRDFEEISETVKNESKLIVSDVSFLRRNILGNKSIIKKIINMMTPKNPPQNGKKRRTKKS